MTVEPHLHVVEPQRGLDPTNLPLHGTHLIEASAGTGKTYTIATLYVRLVLEVPLTVDQILVVTFTEAAAAELRDRIRKRLRAALAAHDSDAPPSEPTLRELMQRRRAHRSSDRTRLALAVQSFDEAAISTIHGFCHRVMHDSAFETGVAFETELIMDETPLIDEVVRDLWARALYDSDPMFVGYLQETGVGPRRLMQTARAALATGDAPILPSQVEVDKHPNMAPFLAAYTRVRSLWAKHRHEVAALLAKAQGLYIKRYPKADFPQWFEAMDAFTRDETPSSTLGFRQLDKLAASTLAKATRKGLKPPEHIVFDAIDAMLAAREPLMTDFDLRHLQLRREVARTVRKELPRRKREAGVQSFDDLLHGVDKALSKARSGPALAALIRSRYHAALIDEFQDTDPVQYRIFEAIYGGTALPLYLIGDPKQAIYGFRGADIYAYLRAAASIHHRQRHTMQTNWRSDPSLLQAIERLFGVAHPFLMRKIGFIPVAPRPDARDALLCEQTPLPAFSLRIQARQPDNIRKDRKESPKTAPIRKDWAERTLPEQVADDIEILLGAQVRLEQAHGSRPVAAGDIAVLVRRNQQAQHMQAALRSRGIPAVVYGDASVFETREAADVQRVLAAVGEPTHTGLVKAAITTELMGVTAGELDAMEEDDLAWSRWVDAFRGWNATWAERGFIQMFRALLAHTGTTTRLLKLRDGERRMTNVLHLAELLHTAATQEHLGPAGLLRWLDEARHGAQVGLEVAKLRLESDAQAVQIVTIHRSKGLEYPIVYCPYSWLPDELFPADEDNLRFHDPRDDHQLKLDLSLKPARRAERGMLPHVAQARFEAEAESLRLLYVALTRARHRVVVYWGAFEMAHRSALAYLLFAPALGASGDAAAVSRKVKDALSRLSDEQQSEALHARGQGVWSIESATQPEPLALEVPPTPPLRVVANAPRLRARRPRRRLDRFHRTSSFTELSRSGMAALDPLQGRDYDQGQHERPDFVDARSTGRELEPAVASPDGPEPSVLLAEFPRGARIGNFFHELLEHLDFQAPDDDRRELATRRLRAYGLDVEQWLPTIDEALAKILAAPLLAGGGFRLGDVSPRRRLTELGFVMPVARDALALTRDALADAFVAHPQGIPAEYPDRLRRLAFAPLRGYLKGFIDLVVLHDERWYLIDYKTNALGDRPQDYDRAAMAEAMVADHYILQSHIYALALLRHLKRRVPGFDADRDLGGSLYLFLRGMTERAKHDVGVYFDPIPAARLAALDAVFERGQP